MPLRVMPRKECEFLTTMERGSIAMAKNRGESGQPWRVPRLKYSDLILLVLTEARGEVYKAYLGFKCIPKAKLFVKQ